MKIMAFIFMLTILHYKPKAYESSVISATVKGSLKHSWDFNFTIFATTFLGVVIYCKDSKGNQFEVDVTKDINNDRYVLLKYNSVYKDTSLNRLCGCNPCDDSIVHFFMKLSDFLINVSCNNKISETLAILGHKDYRSPEKNNIVYPIPKSIFNKSDLFSIRVGNIGPYIGHDRDVYSIRDQMVGCMEEFKYNDQNIIFTEKSDSIQLECPRTCSSNICNLGKCEAIKGNMPMCDCSFTALNGIFCNNSMTKYIGYVNNSYILSGREDASFKISWRQSSTNMFCLLNIAGRQNSLSIWLNGSSIMLDNIVISENNISGNNYLRVNIQNRSLTIGKRYNVSRMIFSNAENIRVDVGFSVTNNKCQTFEGDYDFIPDSKLQQDRLLILGNDTEIGQTWNLRRDLQLFTTTRVDNSFYIKMDVQVIVLFVGVTIFGVVVLICCTNLILVQNMSKREIKCNTYEVQELHQTVIQAEPIPIPHAEYDMYSSLDYVNLGEAEYENSYILPKSPMSLTPVPNPPPRNIAFSSHGSTNFIY